MEYICSAVAPIAGYTETAYRDEDFLERMEYDENKELDISPADAPACRQAGIMPTV